MNPDYRVTFDDSVGIECVPRYDVLKMLAEIDAKARQVGRRQGLQPEAVGLKLLALESASKYNLPVVQDAQADTEGITFMTLSKVKEMSIKEKCAELIKTLIEMPLC